MALQRAQGYYRASVRPDGGKEIEDRLYGTDADMNTMPSFGDPHEDSGECYLIKKSNLQPDASGQIWSVDLLYGEDSPKFQYSLEQSTLERPIELATTDNCPANYLMNFTHHLAASDGDAAVPGFWDTATNPLLSAANAQLYRWVRDASELPKESDGTRWSIIASRTKPGVEGFILGSAIVRAQAWYALEEHFEDSIAKFAGLGAVRMAPAKRYGLPSDYKHWLLLPDIVGARDGYYWTFSLRFQYSKNEWDEDLYADGTYPA
jgi:hypothetical protein